MTNIKHDPEWGQRARGKKTVSAIKQWLDLVHHKNGARMHTNTLKHSRDI
jgi:hypothetical protein